MSADGLNRAQRTAVAAPGGPLLVLAGAGTGKTRVITYRIAELIKNGVPPQRVLAVTFTNKAAREMQERARGLLRQGRSRKRGKKGANPEISTFHSLCVRILRRHANRLGYPENFTIYDRSDQESLARTALRDVRVGHQKLRPSDLIQMVSNWKGAGLTPGEAEQRATGDGELLAALCYGKYQASLKASGAMDFDDLLLLTVQLFTEHPDARYAESSRFDHLLIDEYQDTNRLQYEIVRSLAERHRNLCVVGDDDQSIYGWRGAEVEHILAFQEHWPEAKVVRLEENYRSTQWVLHLANTLIAHNRTRHEKKLMAARSRGLPPRFAKYEDENHEAESVVAEIFGRINRQDEERVVASDIAILFRTNEQPRVFEQELRRAGVPYLLVGGQSFFDRKEIKDLLAYLRVISNPLDEVSLLRVINTPARGIGTSTIQTLLDEAVENGVALWKLLPKALEHPDLPPAAANAIDDFRMMIDEYRARMAGEPLSKIVAELVERINYKAEIERQYKDPGEHEARWNAVQELVNACATYESRADAPSLNGFLEESTLSNRDDDKDEDKRQEHAVRLMTLHSAKGLEFPIVYLVGLEEGLLPHKRSVADSLEGGTQIEEERRLAYVGVTRAQDLLTLSFCKNRMKWGKLRPQIPSRFLLEMRGDTEKAAAFAAAAADRLKQDEEAPEPKKKAKKKKRARKDTAAQPASGGESPTRTRSKPQESSNQPAGSGPRPARTNPSPRPTKAAAATKSGAPPEQTNRAAASPQPAPPTSPNLQANRMPAADPKPDVNGAGQNPDQKEPPSRKSDEYTQVSLFGD